MSAGLSESPETIATRARSVGESTLLVALARFPPRSAGDAQPEQDDFQRELRRRLDQDDRVDERVAAAMQPTRPAEVIRQAERNVDPSSRAFRRTVARRQAAENIARDRLRVHDAEQSTQATPAVRPVAASGPPARGAPAALGSPAESLKPPRITVPSTVPSAGGQSDKPPLTAPASPPTPDASQFRLDPPAITGPTLPVTVAQPTAAATRANSLAAAAQSHVRAGLSFTASSAARSDAAAASTSNARGEASPRSPGMVGVAAGEAARATGARAPLARGAGSQPAEPADRDAQFERIVRVLRAQISERRSTMHMRLEPPELGSVRLRLDLERDALWLRIETQTHLAHRLLTEELDSLRAGLEAAGVQLRQVDIRPPDPPPDAAGASLPQQAGPQHEAADGRANPDTEQSGQGGTEAAPFESGTELIEQRWEPAAESSANRVNLVV